MYKWNILDEKDVQILERVVHKDYAISVLRNTLNLSSTLTHPSQLIQSKLFWSKQHLDASSTLDYAMILCTKQIFVNTSKPSQGWDDFCKEQLESIGIPA